MTAALLPEYGQRRLDHADHAHEIGLELRADVRFGRFLNRGHQRIARVVEDDIELAEMRVGLRHRVLDLGNVRHVECQRQYGVAVTLNKIADPSDDPRGRGHFVATLQCGVGPHATEPTGCTCNEPHSI